MNKIEFLWNQLVVASEVECVTWESKVTDKGTYSNGIEYESSESNTLDKSNIIPTTLTFSGDRISFDTKGDQHVEIDEKSDIDFPSFYASIKTGSKLYFLTLKIVAALDMRKLYEKI